MGAITVTLNTVQRAHKKSWDRTEAVSPLEAFCCMCCMCTLSGSGDALSGHWPHVKKTTRYYCWYQIWRGCFHFWLYLIIPYLKRRPLRMSCFFAFCFCFYCFLCAVNCWIERSKTPITRRLCPTMRWVEVKIEDCIPDVFVLFFSDILKIAF